jgi:hypothetical protein
VKDALEKHAMTQPETQGTGNFTLVHDTLGEPPLTPSEKQGKVDFTLVGDDSEEPSTTQVETLPEAFFTEEDRLAAEMDAQESIADYFQKKGQSEFEVYKSFVEPLTESITLLRMILQQNPSRKRLCLIVDCSSSMYRYDHLDLRLTRCMDVATLVMESCWGIERKWDYSIVAHNGQNATVELIPFGQPPVNGAERFRILERMIAQSRMCQGGDNTIQSIVEAAERGQSDLIVVISDGNLQKHDIDASTLIHTFRHCRSLSPKTKIYYIFIAGHVSEAVDILEKIPKDQGFACRFSNEMPLLFQLILEHADPQFPKKEGAREEILDLLKIQDEVLTKKANKEKNAK